MKKMGCRSQVTSDNNKLGEEKCSERKPLVYIRYRDHLLFKATNP